MSQKFSVIGIITLAGLMLLTVTDVLLRAIWSAPIMGGLELTELMMVVLVYPGLAWVAIKRANVKVDLLVGRFSTRKQGIIDSVTCLLSLCIAALIAWFTIPQALYMRNLGIETDLLSILHYPFFFLIAFAYFVLCFALIVNLIESIRQAIKG